MSDVRPRLYLDIDGVLYAHYGGEWQLRPYIVTLTAWAKDHFDVYFVSYNSRKAQVVEAAYAHGEVVTGYFDEEVDEKGFKRRATPGWHPLADRAEKLQAVHKTGGLQDRWIMVEDTPPTEAQAVMLADLGMADRWLVVPDTGADVLLDVRLALEGWLKSGKLTVPYEWATRTSAERDLCTVAEWKGYGLSKRRNYMTDPQYLADLANGKEPRET